jgi:CAAX prenyl protease-like protein
MQQASPTSSRSTRADDIAYVLPMAIFLLFTQAGNHWPSFYPASYIIKTFLAAFAIVICWPRYTRIRWNYWWLGIVFGIFGIVQWLGMGKFEERLWQMWPSFPHFSGPDFDPHKQIVSPAARWSFIAIRWAGASLMVPVMEELFWRDYLWRNIAAPNDFKLAAVGEPDWKALVLVALLFSSVHIQWLTAIVWGLMIGLLLLFTRSLGACIIMHGLTNFLLGLYVLRTGKWEFW